MHHTPSLMKTETSFTTNGLELTGARAICAVTFNYMNQKLYVVNELVELELKNKLSIDKW